MIYDIFQSVRKDAVHYINSEEDSLASEFFGDLLLKAEDKALELAKYVKECELEVAGMKEAEQSIARRRKALEKKVDGLKAYILTLVKGKVSDAFISVSTRKSERVVVHDGFDCDEYMIEKVTRVPDKLKIKDELKAGVIIEGASLEQCVNLVIK